MGHEVNIEQIVIAQFFWVEADANGFRMAGSAGANLLVGRVRPAATGIDAFNGFHANNVFKYRFGTPETSATKDSVFDCHTDSFTRVNDSLCIKTSRLTLTKESQQKRNALAARKMPLFRCAGTVFCHKIGRARWAKNSVVLICPLFRGNIVSTNTDRIHHERRY